MNTFTLLRPESHRDAARAFRERADVSLPVYKAGGMDIVDHMKEGLMSPDVLIDVRRLRRADAASNVSVSRNGPGEVITIEAAATMAEVASSEVIVRTAPVLAQACDGAATPQVRNIASIAGNLLQRPRCWYYRHQQFHCLKKGGNTCYATEGENRYHAILGGGPCHIVHPSNVALPLFVLDGRVHYLTADEDEDGSMPIAQLYNDGRDWVQLEHTLPSGAVITHITFEGSPASAFYAVKEKQSFDWPVVMAAVSLRMNGDVIEHARVCAGAVAPWPWPLPEVEARLRGVSVGDEQALEAACAGAADGARPMRDNAFKVRLLPVAVRRAVLRAAGVSTA